MHELERRALDDPFLADALDGFEHASTDQEANLFELSSRLHQRTEKKTGKIIPWIPLSAAASIAIVLVAGIWFFSNRNDKSDAKRTVAQNVTAKKTELPNASNIAVAKDSLTAGKNKGLVQTQAPKTRTDKQAAERPKATIQDGQKADVKEALPTVSDLSVARLSTAKSNAEPSADADKADKGYEYKYLSPKKDSIGANDLLVSDMSKKKAANASASKPKGLPSTPTLIQSRVDGVSVNADDNYTVTGKVVGDDGAPLTGATVRVQGRNFGVVTDANGKFTLQDVPKGQTLSVNYIGYSGKKVKADQDSMRISLNPTSSSLAEVVVNKEVENNAQNAHPRDGWKSFNDYLDKNAQSPDGKTGKEKISFIVAPNGTLSQFKAVKSLSDDADKKAISLINAGPAWVGSADGKAKEVTVTVKFH